MAAVATTARSPEDRSPAAGTVGRTGAGSVPDGNRSTADRRRLQGELSVITANTVDDLRPDVTTVGDDYLLVWERYRQEGSGADVYWSLRDEDGWSDPAPVENSPDSDFFPSVAYDPSTGRAVAAWSRFVGSAGNASNLTADSFEVFYAVYEDGRWSDPTQLTGGDGFNSRPTVAARDGTFLVSWVGDDDGDTSTTADVEVRLARIRGGEVRLNGSIDANRPPYDVSIDEDGRVRLAFFRRADGTEEILVYAGREEFRQVRRISVSKFRGLGLVGEELVYGDAGADVGDSSVRYTTAGGSGSEPVPTRLGTFQVSDATLTAAGEDRLATYLGVAGDSSRQALGYVLRSDGRWIYERTIDATNTSELFFEDAAVAATDEEFLAVLTGRQPRQRGQPLDLFATTHEFRPDLLTRASTDAGNLSVGDQVTLSYNVTNVGDEGLPEGFQVAAVADGRQLATAAHDALGLNESAEGTFTVSVPESGVVTVRADPAGRIDEIATDNNDRRVRLLASDLTVESFEATRDGDLLRLTPTVRNRGAATASDVTVAFGSPNGTLARTRIDRLAGGESATPTLEVPLSSVRGVNDSLFRVTAPGDDTPGNDVLFARPLRPDLRLFGGQVNFSSRDGQLVATVEVFNAGPAEGRFTLEVQDPGGQSIATTEGSVGPAGAGGQFASTTVTVELPNDRSGGRVTLLASAPLDGNTADNAVTVRVPSIEGLDSTAPSVARFGASDANGSLRVELVVDEPLDSLSVSLSGPTERTLSLSAFDRRTTEDGVAYVATADVDPGSYTVTVQNGADAAGNALSPPGSASVQVGGSTTDDGGNGGGGLGLPGFGAGAALLAVLVALAAVAVARRRSGD